ncbi:MAG: hypothetical protein JO019_01095, partial [Candidatus Kaiserbacteria bacterium]|nr:hypothetical protein [Candidatus Kaiserbacteria bacterium]
SIYRGETKPHVFTWVAFALLDAIVFAAQVTHGAGPGAWAIALGTTMCAIVAVASIKVGHLKIKPGDWVAFAGALIGIALWAITSDPLYAVVLAALVNLIAIYPTARKSYEHPESESTTVWSIDIFRYLCSIAALDTVSLTTALFPAAIVFGNSALVLIILIRRRRA